MRSAQKRMDEEKFQARNQSVKSSGDFVMKELAPGLPRILLVEDDDVVVELIAGSFRSQYDVQSISSCIDLVYILDSFRPHLIILDIGLPWISGIDLCRDLRQSSQYKRIPVLFLSAMTTPEDVAAGLKAGGDRYMTKPFHMTHLKRTVAELLTRQGN